jgi:hypothetical protein
MHTSTPKKEWDASHRLKHEPFSLASHEEELMCQILFLGITKRLNAMRESSSNNLSCDVINCRLRKIASFAAAPGPSSDLLKNMTSEEQALYKQQRSAISE